MSYFVVRILLDLKCKVVRREYGLSTNSKTLFVSSGDKSNFEDFCHKFLQIFVVNVQRGILYKNYLNGDLKSL